MTKEEIQKSLRIHLHEMEQVNAAIGMSLMYNLHILSDSSKDLQGLHAFYHHQIERITPIGETLYPLEEALLTWFCDPLSPFTSATHLPTRITRFLHLVENLLQPHSYTLYELILPFSYFGLYSEHFVIQQQDQLYVFQFSFL